MAKIDYFRNRRRRSDLLGAYFQLKAALWAVLGLAVGWGFVVAGEMGVRDAIRSAAYYILLFLVPGILLWVLGIAVRARHPTAWWFGMIYLVAILLLKVSLGGTDMPLRVWSWTSSRLPTFYVGGLAFFGLFSTLVLAMDAAALASFVSADGRACFSIGNPSGRPFRDRGD